MHLDRIIQLDAEEKILLVVREDVRSQFVHIFVFLLWLLVPFFLFFPLLHIGKTGIVSLVIFCVSALLYGWIAWRRWAYTMCVITSARVVDVEQTGAFRRVITEIPLHKITDVSARTSGFFPTIFRLSTLMVASAGSMADIEFSSVRDAQAVSRLVNRLRNAEPA